MGIFDRLLGKRTTSPKEEQAKAEMTGGPAAQRPTSTLFSNIPPVSSVDFSPDGKLLTFAFFDGEEAGAFVGDATNGKLLLAISPYKESINCVTFSPDGRRLAGAIGG